MERDPIAALAAEGERFDEMLAGLGAGEAARESACPGWSVGDVVLHLAQTEEAVVSSIKGEPFFPPAASEATTVDGVMDAWVAAERGHAWEEVRDSWRAAHRAAVAALRKADPDRAVAWAAAPLKPMTLATTRLSEHWIHGLDISGPLGIPYPDSDRLWHIARLAHRTLPYAYMRAGQSDPPSVYLELAAPTSDETWTFGDGNAECRIRGDASELCRVAARRVEPPTTSLVGEGPRADEVLGLIRTYA